MRQFLWQVAVAAEIGYSSSMLKTVICHAIILLNIVLCSISYVYDGDLHKNSRHSLSHLVHPTVNALLKAIRWPCITLWWQSAKNMNWIWYFSQMIIYMKYAWSTWEQHCNVIWPIKMIPSINILSVKLKAQRGKKYYPVQHCKHI